LRNVAKPGIQRAYANQEGACDRPLCTCGVAGWAASVRRNDEGVNHLEWRGSHGLRDDGRGAPEPIGRSVFEITSEVIAEPTDGDGAQGSAWSTWGTFTAPPEHVIDDTTVEVEWQGRAGSENRYEIAFDEYLAIVPGVPGLTFSRIIRVRTYARCPEGPLADRGWSRIKVTGDYMRYR
jgi:hypothetical protein